ncbi:MAG: VOC family protein [Proteobacteria bacterium]|nr:MAG: VOC family protein [Pseudomonadota bacterium]
MQPVLAVPDVAATVAYCRDVLGFHLDFVHGDPPLHPRVCADPSYAAPTVHLRFEPLAPQTAVNPSVDLWVHVGAGLDELFATYRDRGVTILREPEDRSWGLRQFVVEDCNGYRIRFSGEPSAG